MLINIFDVINKTTCSLSLFILKIIIKMFINIFPQFSEFNKYF